MKPVKNFRCGESSARCGEMTSKCGGPKAPKKVVFKCARQMSTKNPVPQIPGVDQLTGVETGAKSVAGPFHLDQIELLVATAQAARDRAAQGRVFIAPEGEGFTIFKRKAVAK